MTIYFKHEGHSIDYTPAADVALGEGVVVGTMFGVATRPIAANELGALQVCGVFEFPKTAGGGITFAIGDKVYFDEAGQKATSDAGGGANLLIGLAVKAAANADTTALVRIEPQGA